MHRILGCLATALLCVSYSWGQEAEIVTLPGTEQLTMEGVNGA